MDIRQILEHLPHRYPLLLVDRVVEMELGKSIHAYKNLSFNEPFFQGHFPDYPVMPGVLIVEALAQAGGILAFKTMNAKPTDDPDSIFYFVGIDEARFKKPVVPGDQLHFYVEIERQKREVMKFKGQARVNDEIAAETRFMCARRGKL